MARASRSPAHSIWVVLRILAPIEIAVIKDNPDRPRPSVGAYARRLGGYKHSVAEAAGPVQLWAIRPIARGYVRYCGVLPQPGDVPAGALWVPDSSMGRTGARGCAQH
jgi:hypothetical protein